ncbi:MAG: SMC-Scp complex subunit ScpB [Patescibacteria group bacterium]
MQDKSKIIEAILFWKGEPVSIKKLAEYAGCSVDEAASAINDLKSKAEGGITLIEKDGEAMLGTSPEASKIIEDMTREELSKELTKAALETLSVILYMSPVRRSEIDYIRGVNSQFSIRHLEIRGLIEKVPSDADSRVYLYRPTFECLQFLGVSQLTDIPGFADTKAKLESLKEKSDAEEN